MYDLDEVRDDIAAVVAHLNENGYDGAGDLAAIGAAVGIVIPHKMDERSTRDIAGVRTDGNCPRCGNPLEERSTYIEALCDDTAFPTITVTFECSDCQQEVEVEYDAVTVELNYDPEDPDY